MDYAKLLLIVLQVLPHIPDDRSLDKGFFYGRELPETDAFPWSQSMQPRTQLLKDEIIAELPLEKYAKNAYRETILE